MTTSTDLTDQEAKALDIIRDSRRLVATITVRELASAMGYASVSSPQLLIESLEAKGRISRDKRGIIEVLG